jgi:hypothetical protein
VSQALFVKRGRRRRDRQIVLSAGAVGTRPIHVARLLEFYRTHPEARTRIPAAGPSRVPRSNPRTVEAPLEAD